MHLGKAFTITRLVEVADYIRKGENALIFRVRNVDKMTEVLRKMWHDRDLCQRLGEKGRRFAAEHCTEERTFANFKRIIRELGVHFDDDFRQHLSTPGGLL